MIDLGQEKLVTLTEAVLLIPEVKGRGPVTTRTISNWTRHGRRGVVLETVSIGGVLTTSKEALERFFARLADTRERRYTEQDDRLPRRCVTSKRANGMSAARERLLKEHGV